ncbi:MAG: type 1 glutamine amidotransferase [Acidimicrobiia bacterium]|nr:type 1 glutamine amidotransferase [Acidimicrobiia bacterium]
MRIGLLIVGHVAPASTHIAGDYPELFSGLLRRPDIELVRYDIDESRLPASVTECDGWLVSPSRCSVYDEHPWIAEAQRLVREILEAEQPYVGICFGHQLAAQAMGVTVTRAARGWEVGVQDYEIVDPQPWMQPLHSTISLIASHEDQVTALPTGATLLARSPACPIAGMKLGDRAWTLQPHPEFTPELADHLLAQRIELIGAEKVARARSTLGRPLNRLDVGRWIGSFFDHA